METKEIQSNVLPLLNGSTKDLINNGVWFLYTLEDFSVKDAKYCLVADKSYILNDKGSIISADAQSVKYKDRLLFSDLPKPIIQENVAIRWT